MHDPLSFEARLENAFDRYGAAAPTSVDSRVLAPATTTTPRLVKTKKSQFNSCLSLSAPRIEWRCIGPL